MAQAGIQIVPDRVSPIAKQDQLVIPYHEKFCWTAVIPGIN
jgi:hypothetical protein